MNFMKKIDFLSPKITLYNTGLLYHTTLISSLLTILAFFEIFIISLNYLRSISNRDTQKPQVSSISYFIDDVGILPISSKGIFHFISITKNRMNKNEQEFDFQIFKAIGFETYIDDYKNNKNLSEFDHWLYGPCNKESDVEGLDSLITQDYFTKSACIKKYYSHNDRRYYNSNESKFRIPHIAHGTSNINNKFYSVIIEKCEENTMKEIFNNEIVCKESTNEIEDIFKYGTINFYFIDEYFEINKYKNPIRKFFYKIESNLDKTNYFINNIILNPSALVTYDGLIFTSNNTEHSHVFNRNEIISQNRGNNDIYMSYYLWVNNRIDFYFRTYRDFTDFVSDIGGTSNFIINILYFINLFFNSYASLTDTEELLSSKSISIKEIMKPKNKNKIKELKSFFKENSTLTSIKDDKILDKEKNTKSNSVIYETERHEIGSKDENINNLTFINNNNFRYENSIIINKGTEAKNINNENKKVKFKHYFINKISCGKHYNHLKLYEDFRIKVISVENIIKTYLNVNKLEELNKLSSNYFSN